MTIKSPALEWNADRGLGFYTPAACNFVNRQSLQEFCIEFVTVPFCQHVYNNRKRKFAGE
jgi:hypothetical protein